MSLIYNRDKVTYFALSTDIVANKITGANVKGALVYILDTYQWYVVKDDLTLSLIYLNTVSASSSASTVNIANLPSVYTTTGSILAGEAHIGQIGGTGYLATGSFLGASASANYNANTAITPQSGGMVEIPNAFRVAGGSAYITDIGIISSACGITATPRIHFASGSNVTLAPDTGSWVEMYADQPYRLGYFTLPAMQSASGSSTDCSRATTTDGTQGSQPRILVTSLPGSKSLWYSVETRSAFTSASGMTWSLMVRMDQN